MNDIEILEELINDYRNCGLDDFPGGVIDFVLNKSQIIALKNLIKENKELKEKNKKLENEYINPSKIRFSYYDNTKGMEVVLNGFTANSKLKEIIYPTPENYIPLEIQTSEMYKKLEELLKGE